MCNLEINLFAGYIISLYLFNCDCEFAGVTIQWRRNERDGVSNRQPCDDLPFRLFRRKSKKTSKLRVTGLCEGTSSVNGEFPAQRASNAKNVSIDGVTMRGVVNHEHPQITRNSGIIACGFMMKGCPLHQTTDGIAKAPVNSFTDRIKWNWIISVSMRNYIHSSTFVVHISLLWSLMKSSPIHIRQTKRYLLYIRIFRTQG